MKKSTGIGTGNVIGYDRIAKDVPIGFRTIPDKNWHRCVGLVVENRKRAENGESVIHVFKDFDNQKFYIKVGLEFIHVNYCAFCGERL